MGGWRRTTPCERARKWISLRLDGEISHLDDAALTRHLERCAECSGAAAEVAGITELLRVSDLDEPERPFELPGTRWGRRPARRRIAIAAAAFVVTVGSAVAVISVPSPSGLLVPSSSALRFANTRQEIEFVQNKNLTLEPFPSLGVAESLEAAVPAFSQRALR